jgi:hypothetical protein
MVTRNPRERQLAAGVQSLLPFPISRKTRDPPSRPKKGLKNFRENPKANRFDCPRDKAQNESRA